MFFKHIIFCLIGLMAASIVFTNIAYSASRSAENKDEALYFVGLKEDEWVLFYKNVDLDKGYQSFKTTSEPRELYFSVTEGVIYYFDNEGRLCKIILDKDPKETVLFTPLKNDSYAQLFWHKAENTLYMVKMPHGKSSEADIVGWNNGVITHVVRQISSQFEPYIYNSHWLYYGHVHCSLDCGHIIQEVWRKNLVSGEAEQVTLLGQISRQAIVDGKGKWVYFSSNKKGSYHIWRQVVSTVSGQNYSPMAEQISQGDVTDTDPAISSSGELFFIRHSQGKALLMHRAEDAVAESVMLPEGVSEIRNLRINP
jgi:hypothetical protein